MAINQTHDIEAANTAHLACVLLLDTSGSMCGEKIKALNQGLKDFQEIVGKDEQAKSCVDVAIVTFDNEVKEIQGFFPLNLMSTSSIDAKPNALTSMGAGIEYAIELTRQRIRKYNDEGVDSYIPYILMISDGVPTDDITVAREHLLERQSKNRLRFVCAGVKGCDMALFESFYPSPEKRRIVKIDDPKAFQEFFHWWSAVVISVSHSKDPTKEEIPPKPEKGNGVNVEDYEGTWGSQL